MEEKDRLFVLTQYERDLWNSGVRYIGGIDEVGRGPLAGPVMAACVVLPHQPIIEGINDSKKVSPKKREKLFDEIMQEAIAIGIGCVEPADIDEMNILNATKLAMLQSVQQLQLQPEHLLIDAIQGLNISIPQTGIIKGDSKVYSIAAASIIAKVTRDRIMEEYDKRYPQYGFLRNKGYGTKEHIQAIKKYGPCPIHRKTFIRNFYE